MNQPQITIEQAMQTIDSICSQYKGTRDEHVLIINSLNLIKQELNKVKQESHTEKNEIVNNHH